MEGCRAPGPLHRCGWSPSPAKPGRTPHAAFPPAPAADPLDRQLGQVERGEPRHRGPPNPWMRRAAALAGELDPPAGAADPGNGQRRGGRAGDPPAGDGGGRRASGSSPLRRQRRSIKAGVPPLLGGELEPAGGGHAGAADLADHRGEAAMAQPLLHHRQHFLVAAAFGIEQPVRRRPAGEAGREQVAAGRAPTAPFPPPFRSARGERGGEQGRGGLVAGAGALGRRLVQGAATEGRRRRAGSRRSIPKGRLLPLRSRPADSSARISARRAARRSSSGGAGLHRTRPTRLFSLCSACVRQE